MKTIFEDENILVQVRDIDHQIIITNKNSDAQSNRVTIMSWNDGHLTLLAPNVRWHPRTNGFDLWLN